ncbi:hypothetical protein PIB30_084944, partial [Stylosanthes scabra]|nr:hypothetical protein [Stylosanthes scabra]
MSTKGLARMVDSDGATSLTPLLVALVLKCWLASVTVSISSHASFGILFISAPPLDALIIA